jgi:hypothetical protein
MPVIFPSSPAKAASRSQTVLYAFLILLTPATPGSAQETANASASPGQAAKSQKQVHEGPWGSLQTVPIFLEAPSTMVESFPLPNSAPRWSFPEAEAPNLPTLLTSMGLPASLLTALSQPTAQIREGGWVHLFPPGLLVQDLDPEVRSKLYIQLSQYDVNEFHHDPVLILSDTVEEWYRSSSLRPEVIAAIAKLAYRRGDVWAFSDLPLVLDLALNESEARDIFRTFTRTRTYLVKLNVTPSTDAAAVRHYWSIGGKSFRLKSLEPLLNSIKETGEAVELDISHIIPALPRKLIYNYPGTNFSAKGILPDCHWTSLNFFNYEPHDYLLNPRLATNKVLDDYSPVEPPYTYGDILFFIRTADGDAFHSCLYLAGDFVFTKNGRNQLSPWIISTIADVSRVYLSVTPGRIQAYRRKDQFLEATE